MSEIIICDLCGSKLKSEKGFKTHLEIFHQIKRGNVDSFFNQWKTNEVAHQ
jgi:hypothetical protein